MSAHVDPASMKQAGGRLVIISNGSHEMIEPYCRESNCTPWFATFDAIVRLFPLVKVDCPWEFYTDATPHFSLYSTLNIGVLGQMGGEFVLGPGCVQFPPLRVLDSVTNFLEE